MHIQQLASLAEEASELDLPPPPLTADMSQGMDGNWLRHEAPFLVAGLSNTRDST
jgi:hypothetical protein